MFWQGGSFTCHSSLSMSAASSASRRRTFGLNSHSHYGECYWPLRKNFNGFSGRAFARPPCARQRSSTGRCRCCHGADEVPLRVCLELESNTLDPLFLAVMRRLCGTEREIREKQTMRARSRRAGLRRRTLIFHRPVKLDKAPQPHSDRHTPPRRGESFTPPQPQRGGGLKIEKQQGCYHRKKWTEKKSKNRKTNVWVTNRHKWKETSLKSLFTRLRGLKSLRFNLRRRKMIKVLISDCV